MSKCFFLPLHATYKKKYPYIGGKYDLPEQVMWLRLELQTDSTAVLQHKRLGYREDNLNRFLQYIIAAILEIT